MHSFVATHSQGYLGPRRLSHLARVRVLAGHTQQSLADSAGISKRTVVYLEAGTHRPSLATAFRLANALGHQDVRVLFPDFTTSPRGEADR